MIRVIFYFKVERGGENTVEIGEINFLEGKRKGVRGSGDGRVLKGE